MMLFHSPTTYFNLKCLVERDMPESQLYLHI
uniref:Uncharacterized protein n=1 Tax=Rhizophora mucronata TaxID=61149 RepID=A0A2P2P0B6_RHIMU